MTQRIGIIRPEQVDREDEDLLLARWEGVLEAAARHQVRLVVLPALWGWWFFLWELGRQLGVPGTLDLMLSAPLSSLAIAMERVLARYGQLASRWGFWLVGSALPLVEGEKIWYAVPVLSPEGRVVGWQRQTHLSAAEQTLRLRRGEDLEVITTPLGRLGIVLGQDVLMPEVSRILCLLGAEILVHQGIWPEDSRPQWMSRLWREVQANQVFGLESALVMGQRWGRAACYGPCELTADLSGVLAQTVADDGQEILVVELDWEALRQVVAHYPIHAMRNEALYQRYFPAIYTVRESP
jgi:predicted amidohydrolase